MTENGSGSGNGTQFRLKWWQWVAGILLMITGAVITSAVTYFLKDNDARHQAHMEARRDMISDRIIAQRNVWDAINELRVKLDAIKSTQDRREAAVSSVKEIADALAKIDIRLSRLEDRGTPRTQGWRVEPKDAASNGAAMPIHDY